MNDTLKHFGILGMKWGVRRSQAQLSNSGKNSKKNPVHDDSYDVKNAKSLSNAELRDHINRFQMEKQYSQLTQKEQSAGAKFIKSVLSDAAKQTASKYASQYISKGVDALIKKAIKK